MAGSKKPYPCCGSLPGIFGRPANEVVCYDCLALISLGREYKRLMGASLEEPETILVNAPAENDWDCPSFYTKHSQGDPFKVIGQLIKRLIFTLAVKASHYDESLGSNHDYSSLRKRTVRLIDQKQEKTIREAFHVSDGHTWNSVQPVLMHSDNIELIEELVKEIDVALRQAQNDGVEYGKNQLQRLVDEEITVNELNPMTTRGDEK